MIEMWYNDSERTKQMEPILIANVKIFSKVKILKNAFKIKNDGHI